MVRKRTAFTLIELLIVIAIIGILIAAIAVAVTKAKEFANNNDQKANLKNLATACRTSEVENNKLPPAYGNYGRPRSGTSAQVAANLFIHLLPYLENKALFDSNNYTTTVRVYISAMDPSMTTTTGRTSFAGNIRVFSLSGNGSDYAQAVSMSGAANATGLSTEKFNDGAGNTVLFTTRQGRCNTADNTFTTNPNGGVNAPFFGGGQYTNAAGAGTQIPTSNIPTGTNPYPAYQISPSLATTGANICNMDTGVYGHSFGGSGLAVALGDTSVRNLGFAVTGATWARAIHPFDGLALGTDW